jgi:uncharacterized protein YodC (DUF2158 family)
VKGFSKILDGIKDLGGDAFEAGKDALEKAKEKGLEVAGAAKARTVGGPLEIKVGAVVRHKEGGPNMLVATIKDGLANCWRVGGDGMAVYKCSLSELDVLVEANQG